MIEANTRAYYTGLRMRVRAAGREAARDVVAEQVEYARAVDDGRHRPGDGARGGWRDRTKRLRRSIRATRDRARSTPDVHVFQIHALEDYAVHVERLGFPVVSGLRARSRGRFQVQFKRRFREVLD